MLRNDFQNMARKVGFPDPRLVEDSPITIHNVDVERTISESGNDSLEFFSVTSRLWKLDLEPHCEDYGQAVIYKGTMDRHPSGWLLHKHLFFETGKIHPVCGNTYKMLHETRLKEYFDFVGTWDKHYGFFAGCASPHPSDSIPSAPGKRASKGGCCC
jgi:arsenite methyltransferase